MSGFYNTLFGEHGNTEEFLKILGITLEEIPRFRSCYWNGEYIVIHTRTGGGNREYYQEMNNHLTTIKGYSHDEDMEFDNTYADFYFNPPKETLDILKNITPEIAPEEQWKILFDQLNMSK